MRRGLDTNVLVYAHLPAFEEHQRVRAFLLEQLAREELVFVMTPGVLHEFVHVVTDGRRFDPPLSMVEALTVARLYLGRSNVECVASEETDLLRAFDLLEMHGLGRKRIADALFAATLMSHGVAQLVTCDARGYEPFAGLTVIDPRA